VDDGEDSETRTRIIPAKLRTLRSFRRWHLEPWGLDAGGKYRDSVSTIRLIPAMFKLPDSGAFVTPEKWICFGG